MVQVPKEGNDSYWTGWNLEGQNLQVLRIDRANAEKKLPLVGEQRALAIVLG